MKLTVTTEKYNADNGEYDVTDVEFNEVSHYEFIDEFFIVIKQDGTQQGIRKALVQKFSTTI